MSWQQRTWQQRTWQQRIDELQIELPSPAEAKGAYVTVITNGNQAYTSGHLPVRSDGSLITGKVGVNLSVEEGYEAAKLTALGILASLKQELGSLNRIKRLIKVMGLVNCSSDFNQHPAVINGCSELLIEIFGQQCGKGTRSAFGAVSLPLDVAVEIEAIFEIDTD